MIKKILLDHVDRGLWEINSTNWRFSHQKKEEQVRILGEITARLIDEDEDLARQNRSRDHIKNCDDDWAIQCFLDKFVDAIRSNISRGTVDTD